MPVYLITCIYNADCGAEYRVDASSPDKACEIALAHAKREGCSVPSSMLRWVPSVSALQDESYEHLAVPTHYADAQLRIEQLEQMLSEVVAGAGEALPKALLVRIGEILPAER